MVRKPTQGSGIQKEAGREARGKPIGKILPDKPISDLPATWILRQIRHQVTGLSPSEIPTCPGCQARNRVWARPVPQSYCFDHKWTESPDHYAMTPIGRLPYWPLNLSPEVKLQVNAVVLKPRPPELERSMEMDFERAAQLKLERFNRALARWYHDLAEMSPEVRNAAFNSLIQSRDKLAQEGHWFGSTPLHEKAKTLLLNHKRQWASETDPVFMPLIQDRTLSLQQWLELIRPLGGMPVKDSVSLQGEP